MRRLVVLIGLMCLMLITAVSAGNTPTGQENAGGHGSDMQQPPPNQTEDPNAQPTAFVPTEPVVVEPTQQTQVIQPTQDTGQTTTQQGGVPIDPLTGVYCATSSSLIRINGVDAPQPSGGCVCVKAYGVHTLETGPDLYSGPDESRPGSFASSPQQCLSGVTTYAWSQGTYAQVLYEPNPNGESIETAAPVDQSLTMVIDARVDMETLANNTLGTTRPPGWSGSAEITDPTLPLLVRFDLELLSDALLGAGVRPSGWFGSVPSTPFALVRDIRHDLELLADERLGKGSRPSGWAGTKGNPLLTCNRSTQTLVNLLQRGGVFTLVLDSFDPDYCLKAELAASTFTETNLLTNPADDPIFTSRVQAGGAGAFSIDTDFAVAFLDKGAALSVGVIPSGESIKPVARSIAQFSRMTLVEGADFLVFVDYRDTTLTEDQFEDLPDAGEYPTAPFCSADWCGD